MLQINGTNQNVLGRTCAAAIPPSGSGAAALAGLGTAHIRGDLISPQCCPPALTPGEGSVGNQSQPPHDQLGSIMGAIGNLINAVASLIGALGGNGAAAGAQQSTQQPPATPQTFAPQPIVQQPMQAVNDGDGDDQMTSPPGTSTDAQDPLQALIGAFATFIQSLSGILTQLFGQASGQTAQAQQSPPTAQTPQPAIRYVQS